jgi:hypothetical protein
MTHHIISFEILDYFYNRGFMAYDAVQVDMSSETRNRKIRYMVNEGLVQSKPYTNNSTGKSYNLFKITDKGRKEYRREKIIRAGKK